MESILNSIKKLLMLSEDDTSFDTDIIIHINSVLSILHQLGVWPDGGFTISDRKATWHELIGDYPNLDAVRSFVYLRWKMLFDPPTNSAVIESINRTVGELEWRINTIAEAIRRNTSLSG